MFHLVQMPFGSVTLPSLALGQMKAQLQEAGGSARVFHFNLDFARRVGPGAYETIARFKGVETQVGEWLFAREAWGRDFGPGEERFLTLCGEELEGIPHVADPAAWLRMVRHEVVPRFLDACVERLEAAGPPRVVAFSCTFFQTVASLALGRRLRQRYPDVRLVYGGACFHGEMGEELLRAVPFIDAVSVGEADDVLVKLFSALEERRPPAGLQGIHYRETPGGPVREGPPVAPMSAEVLEALPDPDFDDFFSDAARVGLSRDPGWQQRVLLPFEASRGCWWGQKQHCTFCGLNGEGMSYRAKSAERVYRLFTGLARRYPGIHRFQAADNILPMSYFKDLVPRLAQQPPCPDFEVFWTVKANLRRQQLRALARAGILYLQPGIESLSDNILQHMRKGVSALQNVYFLRVCREEGLTAYWNNLIRLPGETAGDYARMVEWLPRLFHLRPPYGGSPEVECHRFSPYFFEKDRWATGLRPMAWYSGVYPEDQVRLERVAYYFEADWHGVLGEGAYDGLLEVSAEWTRLWRDEDALPRCVILEQTEDGGLLIEDTRRGAPGQWRLEPLEARIYAAIDAPSTPEQVADTLREEGVTLEVTRLREWLERFVARNLALTDGRQYLALALARGTAEDPLFLRSRRLKRVTNQQPSRALRVGHGEAREER